jgi:hypothetical protein
MIKRYLFLTILIFATFASLAPLHAAYIPDDDWFFMSWNCSGTMGDCQMNENHTCTVNRETGACTVADCGYVYGEGDSVGTESKVPLDDGLWLLLIGALGYMLYVRQRRVRKVHKVIKFIKL